MLIIIHVSHIFTDKETSTGSPMHFKREKRIHAVNISEAENNGIQGTE